jgi:UDP-N-acetyl-D-glucosamine dehydrogenase
LFRKFIGKLLENIFRSVNIALVNELARLCDRIGGISMWEVVEAAATKPFGFMPFYPGPGLGGHCIPIDPYYLSWLARRYDFETSFITLSARTNEEMPFYVFNAVVRAVASQGIMISTAKILVLGVAFKRDVDDTRHSPAEKVMSLLVDGGFEQVAYSDPHVKSFSFNKRAGRVTLESVELTTTAIEGADVVVLLTDHSTFPYSMISERAKKILDTRNAFGHIRHDRDNILLLGGGNF